jgi:DNA-binding NarL/FixJ family response regulator
MFFKHIFLLAIFNEIAGLSRIVIPASLPDMQFPEPMAPHVQLRILVIDDDEVDFMRVERMLRAAPGWQIEIEAAVDKASGLAALRAKSYDCVLLDYRLPDGHGLELLAEIHAATGECPPIIMETTLDNDETAIKSLSRGAQDYLVKGKFDSALLQRAIRHAIQRDQLIKERNRLTMRLQEALIRVKALEGLLPTCAWCRKIQDSDGGWQPLENYITRHSNAKFTHGICPECMKKQLEESESSS